MVRHGTGQIREPANTVASCLCPGTFDGTGQIREPANTVASCLWPGTFDGTVRY